MKRLVLSALAAFMLLGGGRSFGQQSPAASPPAGPGANAVEAGKSGSGKPAMGGDASDSVVNQGAGRASELGSAKGPAGHDHAGSMTARSNGSLSHSTSPAPGDVPEPSAPPSGHQGR